MNEEEREALGIREEMKVEGRQGQRTAGRGLAQLRLVGICHLFPSALTIKNLNSGSLKLFSYTLCY